MGIAELYSKVDKAMGGILPGGVPPKPIGMTGMTMAEAKRAEANTMRNLNVTTVINPKDPNYKSDPSLTGYFEPKNMSVVNVRPYSPPGIFAVIGNTVLKNTGAYTTMGKDKSQNISQSHEFAHRLDIGGKFNSTIDFRNASGMDFSKLPKQYGASVLPYEARAFAYEKWVQNPEKFAKQYPKEAEVFAKAINYSHKTTLMENIGAIPSLIKTFVTGAKDVNRQVNELKPELWKAGDAVSQGGLSNLNQTVGEVKQGASNVAGGFWNSFFGGLKGGTGNVVANNNVRTQIVTLPSGDKAIVPAGASNVPVGATPSVNIPKSYTIPNYNLGIPNTRVSIQEIPKIYVPDNNFLTMSEKDFAFKQRGIDSYNTIAKLNNQLQGYNNRIDELSKNNVVGNTWVGSDRDYQRYQSEFDKYQQLAKIYQTELNKLQTFGGKVDDTGIYPPTVSVGIGKLSQDVAASEVINQNPFKKLVTTVSTAGGEVGGKLFSLPYKILPSPSDEKVMVEAGKSFGSAVGGIATFPIAVAGAGVSLYERRGDFFNGINRSGITGGVVNFVKNNPEDILILGSLGLMKGAKFAKSSSVSSYLLPKEIIRDVRTARYSKNVMDEGVYVPKATLNLGKDMTNLNIKERLKGVSEFSEIYPSVEKVGVIREKFKDTTFFRGKEGVGYGVYTPKGIYEFVDYGKYVKRTLQDNSGKGIVELWKVKGFGKGRVYSGKVNPPKDLGEGVTTNIAKDKTTVKFDEANPYDALNLKVKTGRRTESRKKVISREGDQQTTVLNELGATPKVNLNSLKVNIEQKSTTSKTSYKEKGIDIYQKEDYLFSDIMRAGPRKALVQFKNEKVNLIAKKESGQQIVYGNPNELDLALRQEKKIGELITKKISPKSGRQLLEASDSSLLYVYRDPKYNKEISPGIDKDFIKRLNQINKLSRQKELQNRLIKRAQEMKRQLEAKQRSINKVSQSGDQLIEQSYPTYVGGTNVAKVLEVPSTIYVRPVEEILRGPKSITIPNFATREQIITPTFKMGVTEKSLMTIPTEKTISPSIQLAEIKSELLLNRTEQLPKQEQELKQLLKNEQLYQLKTEQLYQLKNEQLLRNQQRQQQQQRQLQLQMPLQLQQRQLQQKSLQSPRQIQKPGKPIKPPFITSSNKKDSNRKAIKKPESFYVLTMKRKKPVLITSKPLSKQQALSFGVRYTKGTERATFRLVPTKKEAVRINIKPMTETEVMQMGYRVPVKKGKVIPTDLVFIQKRPTRMGTIKETKAIQSYKRGKTLW